MKLIEPNVEILTKLNNESVINTITEAARTCYKSNTTEHTLDENNRLVKTLIDSHHEAMLEFFDITVKFTCSRSISHELVRHRLCSFAQESQRYCNYSRDKFNNEITFIKPHWYSKGSAASYEFESSLKSAEQMYFRLLGDGLKAQDAREVLPNATKTEIVVKANLREWRHFLKLRCDKSAHPDMRKLALLLLNTFKTELPTIFQDINEGE